VILLSRWAMMVPLENSAGSARRVSSPGGDDHCREANDIDVFSSELHFSGSYFN
jgi:hypothetical protein